MGYPRNGKKFFGGQWGKFKHKKQPLADISQLLDKVLILLGQSVNTCKYVQRFDILMTLVNDKKEVETLI